MADNIVGNLFGVDPAALQRQQQLADQNQAYRYAQLDPMQQAKYLQATGAAGLTRASGGLLGLEDPELAKASKIKQIASGIDMTSATGLRQLAESIKSFAPQEAMMAIKAADDREATSAQTKLREAQTAQAEAGKLIQVDAGDKVLVMNALTREIVREIPKGMTAAQTAKQEAADAQKTEVAQTLKDTAIEGRTLITKVRDQVGLNTVGIGSALSWLPMTDARKFSADLETLKSQLTMAAMNAAKAQSKTGATGFGALNKEELKVLQSNIAKLDTGLSPDQFNEKLDDVLSYFDKLDTKADRLTQPKSSPTSNVPDGGEFADDYKKYKEKYGTQALPYNVYVQKRKG